MKKLGLPWLHKHNVLQNTLRLSRKKHKKGSWYVLRYEFLPMGEHDYNALNREYWDEVNQKGEYFYATHWLVAIYCYDHNSLRINTIPCSSDGSSPTISPVQITTSLEKDYYPSMVEMSKMFDDKLKKMKNDSFWTYR